MPGIQPDTTEETTPKRLTMQEAVTQRLLDLIEAGKTASAPAPPPPDPTQQFATGVANIIGLVAPKMGMDPKTTEAVAQTVSAVTPFILKTWEQRAAGNVQPGVQQGGINPLQAAAMFSQYGTTGAQYGNVLQGIAQQQSDQARLAQQGQQFNAELGFRREENAANRAMQQQQLDQSARTADIEAVIGLLTAMNQSRVAEGQIKADEARAEAAKTGQELDQKRWELQQQYDAEKRRFENAADARGERESLARLAVISEQLQGAKEERTAAAAERGLRSVDQRQRQQALDQKERDQAKTDAAKVKADVDAMAVKAKDAGDSKQAVLTRARNLYGDLLSPDEIDRIVSAVFTESGGVKTKANLTGAAPSSGGGYVGFFGQGGQ